MNRDNFIYERIVKQSLLKNLGYSQSTHSLQNTNASNTQAAIVTFSFH